MDELLIRGRDLLPPTLSNERPFKQQEGEKNDFSSVLRNAIDDINNLQLQADNSIKNVHLDNSASIHEAMIALEKADISFRAMMQVRNKIMDAYQEIMRMQV